MTNCSTVSKAIATFMSVVLALALIPSYAYADSSEQTISEGKVAEASEVQTSESQNIEESESSSQEEADEDADNGDNSHDVYNETSVASESDDEQATKDSNSETIQNEAGDAANSWRFEDGQQVYSYDGINTEAVDASTPALLSAAPGASSYATWTKSNGISSYTYKAKPSDAGERIAVQGVKRVGIDVSEHQGTIDWAKVRNSGVSYAIIRCGYGSDLTSQDDDQFINNVRGAQANGIDIGIYLYSYAQNVTGSNSSAESEAKHVLRLLKTAGLNPSDLAFPVYYDLEENSQTSFGSKKLGQMASTFCNAISSAGYEVGIYANQNWWRNYLTDSVFSNSNWRKWVARYPGSNKATSSGVSGTEIWQFSDCGSVDGINGNTDMDFCYTEYSLWQEQKIDGKWYYVNIFTGEKATGLRTIRTDTGYKTVYYGADGAMLYGQQKIDDKWYYFKPGNGAMAVGITYLPDENKTVCYGTDGAMLYGQQKIDGKWYYFKPGNGSMMTGIVYLDDQDKTVCYDTSGAMVYGFYDLNGSTYYLKPGNGAMLYGEQKIDGKWYYFEPSNGVMAKGITELPLAGKTVCYAPDGAMVYGFYSIGENTYYFKPGNGAMLYGQQKIDDKWYYFDDETGILNKKF